MALLIGGAASVGCAGASQPTIADTSPSAGTLDASSDDMATTPVRSMEDAGAAPAQLDATAGDPPAADSDDRDASVPAIHVSTCINEGTAGATSDCLRPTMPPDYYVDQALAYFDTLDVDADRARVPRYAELVARWEWPPWLLLTAYGRDTMNRTADILRSVDPSTVPRRDCRAFEEQPFARCYVDFEYDGGPCPIYEEFTFNDQGETTFIEAWSDQPGLLPMLDQSDTWAEGAAVSRLSTRVPGLGNAEGRIDLNSEWMARAAQKDPDVAEFQKRARNQWWHWSMEYAQADSAFFARGCGW